MGWERRKERERKVGEEESCRAAGINKGLVLGTRESQR